MGELVLEQLNNENRVDILNKLGYSINDEGYVTDSKKKEVICKYTEERIHINTAAILPGSVMVINATPLAMAQYFMEFNNED